MLWPAVVSWYRLRSSNPWHIDQKEIWGTLVWASMTTWQLVNWRIAKNISGRLGWSICISTIYLLWFIYYPHLSTTIWLYHSIHISPLLSLDISAILWLYHVISLIVQLFIPFLCRSVSPAVSGISLIWFYLPCSFWVLQKRGPQSQIAAGRHFRFLPLAITYEVNHGKPLVYSHIFWRISHRI